MIGGTPFFVIFMDLIASFFEFKQKKRLIPQPLS